MILGPSTDDDELSLADWLELTAFFAKSRTVNLDEIENAFDIEQDVEVIDIAENDADEEGRAVDLAEEIKRRSDILKKNYPFAISDNGEQLSYDPDFSFGGLSYLVSLIISNSWSSGKLQAPLRLTAEELRVARDIFEIVSVLAALGRTGGPAFLIGTNRAGAEALRLRIEHICDVVGEGRARGVVPAAAPAAANDDGVDLIAIEQEPDGPPQRRFSFGQSASGQNFKGKPIANLIPGFLDIWFETAPRNTEAVMYIPAILSQHDLRYYNGRLGHMMHRPRLAAYSQVGFELLQQNADLLHYVDNTNAPREFFDRYIHRLDAG